MSRQIVHVYGFMDKPLPLRVGLCPESTVPEAVERIRSNIEHFGGEVVDFRRTYPLGESVAAAVEARFHSPGHGETRGMWHVVAVADADEWAAKP